MQHRALKKYKEDLENGGQIAVVIPGRVFRNEDADATHEHTFTNVKEFLFRKTRRWDKCLGF